MRSRCGRSRRSTPASPSWWRRPPARARPWWPSSRSSGRSTPTASASTRRRSRRSRTRSSGTWSLGYGAAKVGLLTGDNAINGDAPIVVMTTEVLRNMLYERSETLDGLVTVVMDEVHYLQDPYRGGVWEEVLIHLPLSISVVCLSATISNAEEFGEWIGTLRGVTRVVIEEKRPVPLEHHYLVGRELHPMHVEQNGQAAAEPLRRLARPRGGPVQDVLPPGFGHGAAPADPRPREGHRRVYVPRREEVVGGPGRAGHAPGDLLRVQPGRLRPQRRVADGRRDPAHHERGGVPDPDVRRDARGVDGRGGPRDARLLRLPRTPWRPGSRRTTPGCCPCSRRPSRSCSRPGW